MKGIILAGGNGTRLRPITKVISKQLLPIYDKPMVYYPLSTLMLAKIRDILIITRGEELKLYQNLLGDGSHLGLNIQYEAQDKASGIAEAFLIGEDFINGDSVSLALGDNIFFGQGFTSSLEKAVKRKTGATVFGYNVKNPKDFGIINFDNDGNILSIEEKPNNPKSNCAVTGLYFYDNSVIDFAKSIRPSSRGELEITDINKIYLENDNLNVEILGRGFAWLDTGNYKAILEASKFIEILEDRQGLKVACIEEIAFMQGWIDESQLLETAAQYSNSSYGQYLKSLI
tara:strand:+ start:57 stop:917 length:861 start_codon:yes stop_codon:yes gene_type:complete